MNKLNIGKRAQIVLYLVEGNSLRNTSRMTNVSINTAIKLLVDVGQACSNYQNKALCNLSCKRFQVDETWTFCYAKQKNIATAKNAVKGAGDIWTWTAICTDTKLIPSWMVGNHDAGTAKPFIEDLASRLKNKIQLTSGGLKTYIETVEDSFGINIDYAMLVKIYGKAISAEKRYRPSNYAGAKKTIISETPNIEKVSTSYVERQNLTMCMGMRRFIHLTNAFSKKTENYGHAIALHFMYYNFGRIHKTLRATPAMEAGVADHVWSLEEIAMLADKISN